MIIYIDGNGNENVIRNDNIAIDLFKRGSIKKDTLVKTSIRGEWKKAEDIEIFQNLIEVINNETSTESDSNNFENETKENNKNLEEETELEIKEQTITSSAPSSNKADENAEFNEIVEDQILETEGNTEELNKAVPSSQSDETIFQNIKPKKIGFGESIGVCFTKYFVFKGRARRSEYWYFILFIFLMTFFLELFEIFVFESYLSVASSIFYLFIFFPSIAVSVRRLHDISRTGWWLFLSFLPIIGSIILLVFHTVDSHKGENIYGKNPKF